MANPTLEKQFGNLPPVDGSAAVDGALVQQSPIVTGADSAMTIGGTALPSTGGSLPNCFSSVGLAIANGLLGAGLHGATTF